MPRLQGTKGATVTAGAQSSFSHRFTAACTTVTLTVELPGCGAGDIQIALLPKVVILKRGLRLLASHSWREAFEALGAQTLFRRFELPALIDVNRVNAELELGVLTVIAPKQAAMEQPAQGVPERPHVFVASM